MSVGHRGWRPAVAAATGLATMLVTSVLLAAGAAAGPSTQVPASRHGFPDWIAGPLRGLGAAGLTPGRFALLLAAVTAGYLLVCAGAGAVRGRWALTALVGLHAVYLLAPPLLSGDAFSYLQYARLGALHGLNPYADAPSALTGDLAYRFASEHRITSPYGPPFTLLTYALVPLGVSAGLWALKGLAAVASLGIVGLVWRAAQAAGRNPIPSALLVGLNPLVLVYGVGGAHNDLLMMLAAVAGVEMLRRGRQSAGAATLVAAVGVKASAALLLPFAALGARRRTRAVVTMAASASVVVAISLLAFGGRALNLVDVLGAEQQRRALHSVPRAVSRLLGQPTLSEDVRLVAALAFVVVCAALLAWVHRGADWVTAAGWAILALLLATTWLLPWYGVWLMPLVALSPSRALRVAALAFTAALVASKVLPQLA